MLFKNLLNRLAGYLTTSELVEESMQRYDYLTAGNADPDLISPAHTGGRLGAVPKNDKLEASLVKDYNATQDKDGNWSVPVNTPYEKLKKLKKLWVKTPKDLIAAKRPARLTPDKDPITNFVLATDFGKGGDSTAAPLVFASLPVFTVLLLLAMHIGQNTWTGLGALLAVGPALGIMMSLMVLEEVYDVAKMIKASILGVVLPLVMLTVGKNLSFSAIFHSMSPYQMMAVAAAIIVAVVIGSIMAAMISGGGGNTWNKGLDGCRNMVWWVVIFGGMDWTIGHLPAAFHAAIWLIPGCLMAVRHVDAAWRERAETLLYQEAAGKSIRKIQSYNPDGPVLGAYRNQVIRAAQDTSPVLRFGTSTGLLGMLRRSPFYYAYLQEIVLSVLDLTMHFFGFGETGSGKTTSLARPALFKWWFFQCGGALIQDGKGQLPFDLESLIDIKLKPGFNWAMLQGMDGVQLGATLKSFKPSGKAVKDSDENGHNQHWNDGANLVVSHVVYLHYQLHRHELKKRAANRVRAAQFDVKALSLDIQEMDQIDVSDKREKVREVINKCQDTLASDRVYPWTYGGVWRTMKACDEVIHQPNDVRLIGRKLTAMKGFLGIETGQTTMSAEELERRLKYEPETIHPEAQQVGSTLHAAIDYITSDYVALAEDTRTSFRSNIAMMFSPLISTGTVFCNANGTPWVEIEQGDTLADVFRGKIAGVFLNTDLYGPAALIVNQISRAFVYSGLRRRSDDWRKKDPEQKEIMIMIDECHLVIGREESNLVTTLRSKGGRFFFLTQGIGQLLSTAGFSKDEAYAMLNQFASICALKTDYDTVEYLEQRAPTLQVTGGLQTTIASTGVIDVETAVADLANSPLEDHTLDQHSHYKRMERAGFGKISVKVDTKDQKTGGVMSQKQLEQSFLPYNQINASITASMVDENNNPVFEKLQKAVSAEEILGNLITKGDGSAIWMVTRAGAPRIDFVKLDGMSAEDVRKACAARSPTTP